MTAKLPRLSMCRLNPTRPKVPKVPKTLRELERTDILITYMDNNDSNLQINEACLVESDQFVGCTAKFDDQWNVIPLRPDLYPKESSLDASTTDYSVDPNFEERGKSLVLAGQSTCFIGVSPGLDRFGKPINYASGTAFFVGPTTLITAAHIVPDGNRKIVAQYPGARRATSFVENLFDTVTSQHLETFKCKFKATGRPNADITILEVCGTYRATVHLEINQVLLTQNDYVDVVGYPGMYNERYVREMHDKPVDGEMLDNVLDNILNLLPRSRLVVTHGPVNSGGMMPTYRLNTVRGMSGSPVILNGKVVGKVFILSMLTVG